VLTSASTNVARLSGPCLVIDDEKMFWQKVNYIDQNPVEVEYVKSPEECRWSSTRLVLNSHLSREHGLDYAAVVGSLGTWAVDDGSE